MIAPNTSIQNIIKQSKNAKHVCSIKSHIHGQIIYSHQSHKINSTPLAA